MKQHPEQFEEIVSGAEWLSHTPARLSARQIAMRQQRVSQLNRIALLLATAGCMAAAFVWRERALNPAAAIERETFPLQCLSPEQAAGLLRPRVGPSGSVVIHPMSPLAVIEVTGPAETMIAARSIIGRYDCHPAPMRR